MVGFRGVAAGDPDARAKAVNEWELLRYDLEQCSGNQASAVQLSPSIS